MRVRICCVCLLILLSITGLSSVRGQETVLAEALGSANLRSGPGISYPAVREIKSGTRYPVIGRSARFPWLLLNLGDGQGWVFADLVKVTGNINSVPFVDESATINAPAVSPTVDSAITTVAITSTPGATLTPQSTPTTPAGIYAEAIGETNVRYGPGTDFPRVGVLKTGNRYQVLRRHTQFKWIEISFPDVAGGRGWVFVDAVKINGNLNSVPTTNATTFGYPTLTATPNMVLAAQPPWLTAPRPTPDPSLVKLGNELWSYLLSAKFAPFTERQASLFLMDLRTGQAISLNPGVAYSGMSLIKIPILLAVYRKLNGPPTPEQAATLAEMMICSDNYATDAMLRLLGDGDAIEGARVVTTTVQQLGLHNTFIVGQFQPNPKATPAPLSTIKTDVDQVSTDPDPLNQSMPSEMGELLGAMYQCALDGTGPIINAFGEDINVTECRQMLRLLSADKINVMIEAGVPTNVRVAHKHGWVEGAVGDAGIVFSAGGDYVLTVAMAQKKIIWPQEFPKVSELSRIVYNAYNPTALLADIHPGSIPECGQPDPTLLRDIQASSMPPIH